MSPTLLTIGSVLAVSLISLIGLALFSLRRSTLECCLLPFISFSSGALLGDVFIHIIPEIAEETESLEKALLILLGGIVFSFIIEKVIHWRHCHVLPSEHHYHPVGILNLFGDGAHNLIDGALIAGSFLVSTPVGIATTVAVALHEIPQEIGDFALLLYSGYERRKAILFNLLSALAALVGAIVVLASSRTLPLIGEYLLPLAAGNFIYIAGADLIPELHKETRLSSAFVQLLSMCAGIGVMLALTFAE